MVDQVRASNPPVQNSAPPLQLFILHRAISHAPPQSTAFDILFYEGQEKKQTRNSERRQEPKIMEKSQAYLSYLGVSFRSFSFLVFFVCFVSFFLFFFAFSSLF